MSRKARTFTDAELQFMKVLWEHDDSTPDEIHDALAGIGRDLTYGTIRNMLVVMIEKGYVARRKRGKVYLYRALVSEPEARKTMLQDMLAKVFDGSESSMIATLLAGKDVRDDEMAEIRRLIDVQKEGDEECED